MTKILLCHASTARLLGATLHIRNGSSCIDIYIQATAKAYPDAIIIVGHDSSIWVWPIIQGSAA